MAVCRALFSCLRGCAGQPGCGGCFGGGGGAGGVRPSRRRVPCSATARGPARRSGLTSRSTGLPAAAGELYVRRKDKEN